MASEGSIRCARCCIVTLDTFSSIIQELIGFNTSATIVHKKIWKTKSFLDGLDITQWHTIQTLLSDGFTKLDFSLIYKIVKYFNLYIEPPTRQWGAAPLPNETGIGDDVERMRRARNNLFHRVEAEIREDEFNDFFTTFIQVGKRVDEYLSKPRNCGYEKSICDYQKCFLDTDIAEKYLKEREEKERLKALVDVQVPHDKIVHVLVGNTAREAINKVGEIADDDGITSFKFIIHGIEDSTKQAEMMTALVKKRNIRTENIEFVSATSECIALYINIRNKIFKEESHFASEVSNFIQKLFMLEEIKFIDEEECNLVITSAEEDIHIDYSETAMSEEITESHDPWCGDETLVVNLRVKNKVLRTEDSLRENIKDFVESLLSHTNGSELIKKDNVIALLAADNEERQIDDAGQQLQRNKSFDDMAVEHQNTDDADSYRWRDKKKFFQLIEFSYDLSLNVVRAFIESNILKDYNNSLENFLNTHKHTIYHLWIFNTKCCIGTCTLQQNRELRKDQLTKLYDFPVNFTTGHYTQGRGKSVLQCCACGINVRNTCSLKDLDIILIHTIIRHCVNMQPDEDTWLNAIRDIRNKLAHVESTTGFDEGRLDKWWQMLEGSVLGLAGKITPSFYYDTIESQVNLLKKSDFDIGYIQKILDKLKAENKQFHDDITRDIRQVSRFHTDELMQQIKEVKDVVLDIRNLSFKVAPQGRPQLQIQNSNATDSCDIQESNICYVRWKLDTPDGWQVQQIKDTLENVSSMLRLWFKVEFVYLGSLIIVTTVPKHVIMGNQSFEKAIRAFLKKFVDVCGINTNSPATVHVELTLLQDFNDLSTGDKDEDNLHSNVPPVVQEDKKVTEVGLPITPVTSQESFETKESQRENKQKDESDHQQIVMSAQLRRSARKRKTAPVAIPAAAARTKVTHQQIVSTSSRPIPSTVPIGISTNVCASVANTGASDESDHGIVPSNAIDVLYSRLQADSALNPPDNVGSQIQSLGGAQPNEKRLRSERHEYRDLKGTTVSTIVCDTTDRIVQTESNILDVGNLYVRMSDIWRAPTGLLPDSDTESDVDMDSIGVDATKKKSWNIKQKLIKVCHEEVGTISSGRRPLNIAIMGPPGCGKSSLLNTIFASFSDEKWKELAEYGSYGELDIQVSKFLISYPKEKYYSRKKDQNTEDDILMPTFIDMNGFEDLNNEYMKELLKIVFYGRMKEAEKFQDVIEEYYANGLNGLKKKYREHKEYLKVDRIIFVCSGDPKAELPEQLMKCVYDVAKGRTGIPVYGVMTKADKFKKKDPAVQKREETFRKHLGVPLTRFARITNYCQDIDVDMKFRFSVIPKLDVKALALMTQVFSRALEVVNPVDKPSTPTSQPTTGDLTMGSLILLITIQVMLTAMLLHFGMKPVITEGAINTICENYDMVKNKHTCAGNIPGLEEICLKKFDILKPPIYVLGGGIIFIVGFLPIAFYTILNRTKNN